MANLTVRKIPKDIYAALKQDAKRHRRSLNAEILAMLADKAEMARRRVQAARVIPELRRLRAEIARKYPPQPDSADLIREDRDNR